MKILKSILIAIIFLNSTIMTAFADDIQVNNETGKPIIKMSGDVTYNLEAGKKTDVTIPLSNPSGQFAYNLHVKAKVEDTKAPFSISFLNSSNISSSIERGGSHNVFLAIDVDKNAPSGKYPVILEYTYTSSNKDNLTGTDTFYIKIDNGSIVPTAVLNNFKSSKDRVLLGETFDISATLENTSGIEASNVSVEVLGLEETNISILGGSNTVFFQKLTSQAKQNISFKFGTTNLTKEGSNRITFKVKYNDLDAKEYTKEYYFYINTSKTNTGGAGVPEIKITSLISPTGTHSVGQSGTFKIKVKNTSAIDAKNIKITAKLPEGIVPTSANIVFINSLASNAEKEAIFSVAPTSSATTQTYSIGFLVEYEIGTKTAEANDKITIEQYAGFNANNPNPAKPDGEKAKTSVPKIIISKYESNPIIVEAGKPFDLSMTFENTHASKPVQNIKIFLTVEDKTEEKGSVFSPSNSSTTFFIDKINPKQQKTHTFNLFAVPDAKPRSYAINVNFEYEDQEANEYKSTEIVGINVKQNAGIELSEITKPTMANVGEPININFQIYNTGKVTLSNFLIKIEGDGFDTSTATNFIGNFDIGASEYYDGMIIPQEAGNKTIKVIISYDDTDGKKIEKIEELNFEVQEMTAPVDNLDNENDLYEENKGFPIKMILIICSVAFVVGIGVFIFIKKAKAKKEMDFND